MQPLDIAFEHPSTSRDHEHGAGFWHPIGDYDELPCVEPAPALSPEDVTRLVNAVWTKVEEVVARFDLCFARQHTDVTGASLSTGSPRHAGSDLDIWGDCLSLGDGCVYAEVFVDKDLVPVVELVVALVKSHQYSGSGPQAVQSLGAIRTQVVARARGILLADTTSDEQRSYHH